MSSADGMQTLPLELLEEDEAVASLPVTPISDSNGTGSPTPSQQMKLAGLKQRGRQASLSQHAMTASGDLDAMAAGACPNLPISSRGRGGRNGETNRYTRKK